MTHEEVALYFTVGLKQSTRGGGGISIGVHEHKTDLGARLPFGKTPLKKVEPSISFQQLVHMEPGRSQTSTVNLP